MAGGSGALAEVGAPEPYQTAEVATMVEIDQDDVSRGFVGARIEQVRCEAPEYRKFVGRKGTVSEAFLDEKGQVHVKTEEDGVWCPARLVAVL
jgi:hypothetical protein